MGGAGEGAPGFTGPALPRKDLRPGRASEYIWSKAADPGETFIEAGARRYARDGVAFSYENCLIAEQEGATVGMAHSFDMEEDPDAEPESDPVLKPYSELEDYGSL